ncbi:MAG TPA: hypothetical protein VHP14_23300 [Anaerolineales bacterium]|nr:hypothetical protein [Anaerolineales bacterium]
MTLSSPLVQAFNDHPLGLCGQHDPAMPVRSVEALEQRLSILTLGVVLDLNHLSQERWSALTAIHDHWLLDPSQVAYRSSAQVLTGMQEARLAGPQYIARVWWQLCRGVQGRFKGSWRALLKANDDDAQALQSYLQKSKATFPVLSGPVISARWLDLIHRIGGVALQNWESLKTPLSSQQRRNARLFGITETEVHPLLASALNTWQTSCKKLSVEFCGLSNCPGKR